MPLTYTGRIVKPGNGAHPSLIDIAVGLSRQPRFAGQCCRWWSVLDHVLFGDELIQLEHEDGWRKLHGGLRAWRLAWLLHDAHEAITADVPTDVKEHTILGTVQDGLDTEIFAAFFKGGLDAARIWKTEVKRIDQICLLAEAHLVGPPEASRVFADADRKALDLLKDRVRTPMQFRYMGVVPAEVDQESHPAVLQYLSRMEHLL